MEVKEKTQVILSFPQLDGLWMIFPLPAMTLLASSCQIPTEMTNGFVLVSSDELLQELPGGMLGVNFGLTW